MNNNSFSVLVRMAILGAMAVLVLLWKHDFLKQVYFSNENSNVGQVFNMVILVLFLLGLIKLAKLLMRYMFEERQLAKFQKAIEAESEEPDRKVSNNSIIARRYQMIRSLDAQGVSVNHSALAATLVADESTRSSFPKFINNSMILMGVFGTIIALSIALVGASDLLGQDSSGGSMGKVIHAMSTALSTTMTAIFCYLFYGYFYLKFNDVQTKLFSSVEQLTTLHILPRYSRSADTLVDDVAGLVGSLEKTALLMQNMQGEMLAATRELSSVIESVQQQTAPLTSDIKVIKKVLREGFRLGDDE